MHIAGAGGSGRNHWFSHWEKERTNTFRVQQANWNGGTLDDWVSSVDLCVNSENTPVVLVAHSLGCIVAAHWCANYLGPVVGAMLVAPADIEDSWVQDNSLYSLFRPIPLERLALPSILVASTNDPYLSISRATYFANAWGSQLRVIGAADHIGSDSYLKSWEIGQKIVDELIPSI